MAQKLNVLLKQVRACDLCAHELPLGPRPVLQVGRAARVLVVGQAPGIKVHETGVPFNDPSGDRLRDWMGVDRVTFYDAESVALLPMAFCYPGRGRGGDLPPPPRCAETWRERLLAQLPNVELTLVLGAYAQQWHLEAADKKLADTVRRWREFAPEAIPCPHPSPRNNRWLRNHPWFEAEVVPYLRDRVSSLLGTTQA